VVLSASDPESSPRVYLIGSGPGGLDQLTYGAAKALEHCDVVVHDDLGASSEDILGLAGDGVEKISVGKRGGSSKSWTQTDICDLMVRLAQDGKVVARLKGGCPSVFSRVNEEIKALKRHDISFKMVPGISSANSAPLSVGIPLTDRELGRHYSVTSAHDPTSIDFSAFAGIDTCVFLMVGKSLATVVEALMGDANKPSNMPCAIIQNGMQSNERSWFGTLNDIVEKTSGESLSPCILVVGNVVTATD
jgi:uroporphyrin-III C-methyltransferase